MVAIVSGDSLGLLNTSAGVLGKNGLIGQAANGATNEMAIVNTANGNLVLQTPDDALAAQGLDISSIRTYNSQGSFNEGNGMGWSMSMIKLVGGLTGTVNTAGSTITRTDGDGNQVVFTYNATSGNYVGHEGSGANNTLAYNAGTSTWLFTGGSTNTKETYASLDASGNSYIASATDISGNKLTYGYTGTLLSSVTDSAGESVTYTYNTNGNLAHIDDNFTAGGKSTRVYYNYDGQNRLINVTVDLSPGDGSITDNNIYWTNYSYVGTTNQISSVTQQDGSQLNFTYTLFNGQQCVSTVADALGRTTTFHYLNSNQTSVTDPNGNVTTYSFDGQGRLTNVAAPAINGVAQTTSYSYDSNGDVATMTDALNNTTIYTYDSNGNMLSEVDALGNTVSYTYNGINQVTSKTEYTVPATTNGGVTTPASGAETTYYVYDANKHLAYTISPEGRVTQNIYATSAYDGTAGLGDLKSTIEYAGDFYTTGNLSLAVQPTSSQMDSWVGGANVALSQRTDYTYDLRGQLASSSTGGTNTVTYVYDPAGNLQSTIDGDANHSTSYTYDGLNRQIAKLDANKNHIFTAYSFNGNSVSVSVSSVSAAGVTGLITLSSYDADGELTSVTQSGSNIATTVSSYVYDADGNLLMSTDQLGQHTYYLYDADGRQIAKIDPTGQLTQTNYNADNQITSVVQYTNLVNTASLINSSTGQPTNPTLASLLAGNSIYSVSWDIYDNAGRLVYSVDPVGDVSQNSYDGAGNVTGTTAYATQLTAAQLATLQTPQNLLTGLSVVTITKMVTISPTSDRTTYYYYDHDNLQIGKVDPDHYLTQTTRNGAGEVTQTTSYATSVDAAGSSVTTQQQVQVPNTSTLLANAPLSTTIPQSATATLETGVDGVSTTTKTTTSTTTNYSPTLIASASHVSTTSTTPYSLNTGALTAGSATWQAGSKVNTSGAALSVPVLVTDAAGNMTSAWIQDGHLMTREYLSVTQAWSSVTQLDSAGGVQQYNLTVSPDGHTLITWVTLVGTNYNIFAALGTSSGWNAPITLQSNASSFGGALQGTVTNGGNAAVAYDNTAVHGNFYVAQLSGGNLAGTANIGVAGSVVTSINLGIDIHGNINATWVSTYNLMGQYYAAGTGWGTASTLQSNVTAIASAFNPAGNGVVIYSQSSNLFAITYNPTTNTYGSPVQITTGSTYTLQTNSSLSIAIDVNGNAIVGFLAGSGKPTVYASVLKAGAWQVPVALVTSPISFVAGISQHVSINANDDVAISWQTDSPTTSEWTAQVAYTVNGLWQSTVTADTSGNESLIQSALDDQGNIMAIWKDGISSQALLSGRLNSSSTLHFVVPANATWSTVAIALYGTANVATQLQNALGNPMLTAGSSLYNLPASLSYTVAISPIYAVQTGDSWTSITQALYGTSAQEAGDTLKQLNGSVDLSTNPILHTLPSPLNYSITVTTTTITNSSPIYTIKSGDSWSSITLALYKRQEDSAVASLKAANPGVTFAVGNQLSLPNPLGYTIPVAVAPYYAVQSGDNWNTIANLLYGNSAAGTALAALNPGVTLSAQNAMVLNVPSTINFTVPVPIQVPTSYSTMLGALTTLPASAGANDIVQSAFYDNAGRVTFTVDGDAYVTQYTYDAAGNLKTKTRYADPIDNHTDAAQHSLTQASLAAFVQNYVSHPNSQNQTTTYNYTLLNQLQSETDPNGATTTYAYDSDGNVTSVTVTETGDSTTRITNKLYNQLGQLVAELSGNASALLAANPGQSAQIWATQATLYSFDADGHLASTTVPALAAGTVLNLPASLTYNGVTATTANATYVVQLGDTWSSIAQSQYGNSAVTNALQGADTNRTLYYYDNDGRLVYTVDAAGQVQGRTYDNFGRIQTQTTYANNIPALTLVTLSGGLLTSAQNPFATLASSSYDSTESYQYNTAGEAIVTTDALGYTTKDAYDAFGAVDQTWTQVDAAGDREEHDITYDNRGQATATRELDDRSKVSGTDNITAALVGAVTTATVYDAFGRVTQTTDARQNVQSFKYDQLGRQIAVTDPLTQQYGTDAIAYDAFDRVVSQTDYLGNTVNTSYDTAARTVTITSTPNTAQPSQTISQTISYSVFGQKVKVQDGNGNTTNYSYDADGNLWSVTDPNNNTLLSDKYDGNDNLVKSTDADGVVTTFVYDAINRVLAKTIDPNGLNLVTSYGYNSATHSVSVTDPNNVVTVSSYDQKGQLKSVTVDAGTGHLNLTTTYQYDARGNALQVTDPLGNVTVYQYDTLGRRVAQTVDPTGLNLATTFVYDNNGNVLTATSPNGSVTNYVYDADNRVAYTIDGAGDVSYTKYDADGNVVQMTQYVNPINRSLLGTSPSAAYVLSLVAPDTTRDNTVYKIYDGVNRLIYSVDGAGSVTQYGYDNNGNVIKQTSYATALPAGTAMTLDGVGAAVPSIQNQNAALDKTDINVYDVRNRLVAHIDGRGDVATMTLDANGNVTQQTSYATAIGSLAGFPTTGSAAAQLSWINTAVNAASGSNSSNRVSNMVYDNANRLIYTVDGTGAVTQTSYDPDGRVVAQIAYAAVIPTGTTMTLAGVGAAVTAAQNAANSQTQNQITQMAYDKAGRLTASATAQNAVGGVLQWAVVSYTYDADGNRIGATAYDTLVGAASWLTSASLPTPNWATDRMTRMAYDKANRLIVSATAQNDINGTLQWVLTGNTYDANGNVVVSTTYATMLGSNALVGSSAAASIYSLIGTPAPSAQDRITLMKYDAANRVVASAMAQNGQGSQLQWAIRSTSYDGNGNAISQTAYANVVAAATPASGTIPGAATQAQISAIAAIIGGVSTNANDRTTHKVFDADNRLVYAIDAAGYVTHNVYDALGQIKSTTLYGAPISVTGNLGAATMAGVIRSPVAPQVDRTTNFTYDAAGNLFSSIDAIGGAEQYTYDALGHKLTYTNAMGSVWTYAYDAAGRQVKAIDPVVAVPQNMVMLPTFNGTAALTTVTAYNAFGDVSSITTEAVPTGFANSPANVRTTLYGYDLAGHQTTVTNPQATVYNAAADNANLLAEGQGGITVAEINASITTIAAPSSTTSYDALGNAISNLDAAGNTSVKTYNNAGQVLYALDADGYVTGNTYNAFGEVTSLTRYYNAIAPGTASGLIQAQVVKNASDRTITNVYDDVGRKLLVIEPQAYIYDPTQEIDASKAGVQAAQTSQSTYDAFGDVTQIAQYGMTLDASGQSGTIVTTTRTTYSYFDQRGNVSAQLVAINPVQANTANQKGYLTTMQYDAAGNITDQYQYTAAVNFSTTGGGYPSYTTPTRLADTTDRETSTTYDGNNRKIAQTVTGQLNAGGVAVGATTTYGYDLLGNLTATKDAMGGVAYTYYDVLGRVVGSAVTPDGSGADLSSIAGGDGTPASQYTSYALDIYGNVLQKTVYANGGTITKPTIATAVGTQIANGAAPVIAANTGSGDRTTSYQYDANGNKIASTDAAGDTTYFDYDVLGRVVKQWTNVTVTNYGYNAPTPTWINLQNNPDFDPGAPTTAKLTSTVETDFSVTTYDAVGQVINVVTPGTASAPGYDNPNALTSTQQTFDAFGEVTQKTVSNGVTQVQSQFTDYDNAGRAWLTNSNNGIATAFLYNNNGQVTEQITTADATVQNSASEVSIGTLAIMSASQSQAGNIIAYGNRYDLQGNLTDKLAPAQQVGVTAASSITNLNLTASATNMQPKTDSNGTPTGSGNFGVTLNLASTSALNMATMGSGDIMVEIDYTTNTGGTSQTMVQTVNPNQLISGTPGSNSVSLTLNWTGPITGSPTAVAFTVGRMQVWKKDVSGAWQQIADTSPASTSTVGNNNLETIGQQAAGTQQFGTFMSFATPENAVTPISVTLAANLGGVPIQIAASNILNFGNQVLVNMAGIALGKYTYQVNYQDIGDNLVTTHDSGTINLTNVTSVPVTASVANAAALFVGILGRAPFQSELSALAATIDAHGLQSAASSLLNNAEGQNDFGAMNTTALLTAVLNNVLGGPVVNALTIAGQMNTLISHYNTMAQSSGIPAAVLAIVTDSFNYLDSDPNLTAGSVALNDKVSISIAFANSGTGNVASPSILQLNAAAALISGVTAAITPQAAANSDTSTIYAVNGLGTTDQPFIQNEANATPYETANTQIAQLFVTIFGRAPVPSEMAGYGTQLMNKTQTLAQIANTLLNLPEAKSSWVNTALNYHWNVANSNAGLFVSQVFNNIAGRNPTVTEQAIYGTEFSTNGSGNLGQTLVDMLTYLMTVDSTATADQSKLQLFNNEVASAVAFAENSGDPSTTDALQMVTATASSGVSVAMADLQADMNSIAFANYYAAITSETAVETALSTLATDQNTVTGYGVGTSNALQMIQIAQLSVATQSTGVLTVANLNKYLAQLTASPPTATLGSIGDAMLASGGVLASYVGSNFAKQAYIVMCGASGASTLPADSATVDNYISGYNANLSSMSKGQVLAKMISELTSYTGTDSAMLALRVGLNGNVSTVISATQTTIASAAAVPYWLTVPSVDSNAATFRANAPAMDANAINFANSASASPTDQLEELVAELYFITGNSAPSAQTMATAVAALRSGGASAPATLATSLMAGTPYASINPTSNPSGFVYEAFSILYGTPGTVYPSPVMQAEMDIYASQLSSNSAGQVLVNIVNDLGKFNSGGLTSRSTTAAAAGTDYLMQMTESNYWLKVNGMLNGLSSSVQSSATSNAASAASADSSIASNATANAALKIVQFFQLIIGRAPDAKNGLNFYLNSYSSGQTLAQIAQTIWSQNNSPTSIFPATLTASQFVAKAFNLLLGRAPTTGTSGELATFSNDFTTGGTVAAGKTLFDIINYATSSYAYSSTYGTFAANSGTAGNPDNWTAIAAFDNAVNNDLTTDINAAPGEGVSSVVTPATVAQNTVATDIANAGAQSAAGALNGAVIYTNTYNFDGFNTVYTTAQDVGDSIQAGSAAQSALIAAQNIAGDQTRLSGANAAVPSAVATDAANALKLTQYAIAITGVAPAASDMVVWLGNLDAAKTTLDAIVYTMLTTTTTAGGSHTYPMVVNNVQGNAITYGNFVSSIFANAMGRPPTPGSDGTAATSYWVTNWLATQPTAGAQNYVTAVEQIVAGIGGNAADNAYFNSKVNSALIAVDNVFVAAHGAPSSQLATSFPTLQVATSAALTLAIKNLVSNAQTKDGPAAATAAANSVAGLAQTVTQLYLAIFNRVPDLGGLVNTIGLMSGGLTPSTQAKNMFASAEGQRVYPGSLTVDGFITQFYQNAFGRSPESGEITAAETKLGAGTNLFSTVVASSLGDWAVAVINGIAGISAQIAAGTAVLSMTQVQTQLNFNSRVNLALQSVQNEIAIENQAKIYAAALPTAGLVVDNANLVQTLTSQVPTTSHFLSADTQSTFDRYGNALSVTNPYNAAAPLPAQGAPVTKTTYNEFNEAVSVQGPSVQDYSSGAANGTIATVAATPTTTTTYDVLGRAITTTDANGNLTQAYYDGYGNVERTDDADGGINLFTYDAFGERTGSEQLNPIGTSTYTILSNNTYAFDLKGNEIESSTASLTMGNASRTINKPGTIDGALGTVDYHTGAINLVDPVTPVLASQIKLFGYDELGRKTVTLATSSDTGLATDLMQALKTDNMGQLDSTLMADNTNGNVKAPVAASYTQYDLAGNVTDSVDGDGNQTRYGYDALNNRIDEFDADGNEQKWTMASDGSNRVRTWKQIGGATLTYGYNAAGQLTNQTANLGYNGNAAQNLSYQYAGAQLMSITDNNQVNGVNRSVTQYQYDLSGNQIATRTMVATSLASMFVAASGQSTTVIQDNHEAYDALNRVVTIEDGRYNLHNSYDANGNLIDETTSYMADMGGPTTIATSTLAGANPADNPNAVETAGNLTATNPIAVQTTATMVVNYNQYDAMNRAVLVDGTLNDSGTTISGTNIKTGEINGTQGHVITYDTAGQRTSDTYYANYAVAGSSAPTLTQTTETYSYDVAGQMDQISRASVNQTGSVIDNLIYNAGGEVVSNGAIAPLESATGITTTGQYGDLGNHVAPNLLEAGNSTNVFAQSSAAAVTATVQAYGLTANKQSSIYDEAGRVLDQTALLSDNSDASDTVYLYDFVGNTRAVATHNHYIRGSNGVAGQNSSASDTVSLLQTTWNQNATYQEVNQLAQSWDGVAGYTGPIGAGKYGQFTDISGVSSQETDFAYDDNNNIASVTEQEVKSPSTVMAPAGRTNYVATVSGQVLDAAITMANSATVPNNLVTHTHTLVAANGTSMGSSSQAGAAAISMGSGPNTIGSTQGYNVLSSGIDNAEPTSYVVQSNDNWSTIALNVWGDASLGWAIEQANSNLLPATGAVIAIPTRPTQVQSTYQTDNPYNLNSALGDTTPTAPVPMADNSGCGAAGAIIEIIVAVAAAYVIGPYAYTAMQGIGLSGTAALVAAGAATGAASSAISQEVGIAIGAQQGFNWKGVAEGALAGGIAAGLSGAIPGQPPSPNGFNLANTLGVQGNLQGVVNAVASSTLTQGISVVTGLQPHFQWSQVAAAGIAAGLTQGLNSAFHLPDTTGSFLLNLAKGADQFAGGVIAKELTGGTQSNAEIAASAFGNALGDSIAANNQPEPLYGKTFGEDHATRAAMNFDATWGPSLTPNLRASTSDYLEPQFPSNLGEGGGGSSAVYGGGSGGSGRLRGQFFAPPDSTGAGVGYVDGPERSVFQMGSGNYTENGKDPDLQKVVRDYLDAKPKIATVPALEAVWSVYKANQNLNVQVDQNLQALLPDIVNSMPAIQATDLGMVSAGPGAPAPAQSSTNAWEKLVAANAESDALDANKNFVNDLHKTPQQKADEFTNAYNDYVKQPNADGNVSLGLRNQAMYYSKLAHPNDSTLWNASSPAEQKTLDTAAEESHKAATKLAAGLDLFAAGSVYLQEKINPKSTAADLDRAAEFGLNIEASTAPRAVSWESPKPGRVGSNPSGANSPRWTPHPEFQRPAPNKGDFIGDVGNSDFALSNDASAAMGLPTGSVVPWVEGIPNFNRYAVPGPGGIPKEFNVPGLTGESGADRSLMLKYMAEETGMTQREIKSWLSTNDVRLHHSGGDAVQIVPTDIHSLHHSGGAQQLRGY